VKPEVTTADWRDGPNVPVVSLRNVPEGGTRAAAGAEGGAARHHVRRGRRRASFAWRGRAEAARGKDHAAAHPGRAGPADQRCGAVFEGHAAALGGRRASAVGSSRTTAGPCYPWLTGERATWSCPLRGPRACGRAERAPQRVAEVLASVGLPPDAGPELPVAAVPAGMQQPGWADREVRSAYRPDPAAHGRAVSRRWTRRPASSSEDLILPRPPGVRRSTVVFVTHDIDEAVYPGRPRHRDIESHPGVVTEILDITLARPARPDSRRRPEQRAFAHYRGGPPGAWSCTASGVMRPLARVHAPQAPAHPSARRSRARPSAPGWPASLLPPGPRTGHVGYKVNRGRARRNRSRTPTWAGITANKRGVPALVSKILAG